ncbi:MAG: ATP-dependent DNA helicase [Candidatus Baltobacteraceae bacterium]
MNARVETIEELFAPDGQLARAHPGFERRVGQVRMAQLVERGILEGAHTIVEAGTGIGKSLAYLVPAIRSGKTVVVSTGTIALQEQLVRKDIPLVTHALGREVRTVLLKGRNHYACRLKLDRMRAERLIPQSVPMERLWRWADQTATGDRGELTFVPPAREWEAIDADADDCIGELCERYRDCWFFRQRDAARYADLVVVNHALFFLDLAMGGTLLPPYEIAILDEAHQCERWATAALTVTVSPASVNRLMRRLHHHYAVPAHYDAELDEAMRGLASTLASVPGERYPLRANEHAPDALTALRDAFYHLENWVHANWESALRRPPAGGEAERRRDLALRGIVAHVAAIERTALPDEQAISWVERDEARAHYEVNSAPFDVADFLRQTLFARTQSVVLTSATIATAAQPSAAFAFLRAGLGVDEAQEYVAPSPFDYRDQARLYVAPARCNPKDPSFAERVAPIVVECLDRSQGRAFVLFTSYRRLREVYEAVGESVVYPTKLQGELPRAHLLEWFRATPNAVLFATATFWEGIDVVGEALSCVIIDRVPFPSPADPLVAARLASLEAAGRSSFEDYMIPAATVRLKQGFGRLIRSKSDRGLVAILDGRLGTMRYGATILGALPPATRIDDLGALDGFFA